MRPIERATLESLQFLVSMHKPESEIYQDKQAKIMSTNYLLLNPIQEEEPCCEMPEREISEDEVRDIYNKGKSLFVKSKLGEDK